MPKSSADSSVMTEHILAGAVTSTNAVFLAVPRESDLAFGTGDAVFQVQAGHVERTR